MVNIPSRITAYGPNLAVNGFSDQLFYNQAGRAREFSGQHLAQATSAEFQAQLTSFSNEVQAFNKNTNDINRAATQNNQSSYDLFGFGNAPKIDSIGALFEVQKKPPELNEDLDLDRLVAKIEKYESKLQQGTLQPNVSVFGRSQTNLSLFSATQLNEALLANRGIKINYVNELSPQQRANGLPTGQQLASQAYNNSLALAQTAQAQATMSDLMARRGLVQTTNPTAQQDLTDKSGPGTNLNIEVSVGTNTNGGGGLAAFMSGNSGNGEGEQQEERQPRRGLPDNLVA